MGFVLDNLKQYLLLKNDNNEVISSLPLNLRKLVKDTISEVLAVRSNKDVSITRRDFKRVIEEKQVSELSVKLLGLF